jgi:hypothetical protein
LFKAPYALRNTLPLKETNEATCTEEEKAGAPWVAKDIPSRPEP